MSFKAKNKMLTFTYSDDGKGLHKDVKNRIFDPFVTTKRGQGGTGLGMNIVFNLVDAKLGGKVRYIESEKGCTFEVVVPIVLKKMRNKIAEVNT